MAAAVAVLDFIWARYTLAISNRAAFAAGGYAAVIYVLGGMVALAYVHEPSMLAAAGVGAFIGTYAATRWGKNT